MNCKKARKIILAGYLDGEVNARVTAAINEHLARCSSCRGWEAALQEKTVQPFQEIKEIVLPPDRVWGSIRRKIAETQETERLAGAAAWRRWIVFPRKYAMAAVAAIIIALAVVVIKGQITGNKAETTVFLGEQVDFLVYLDSGDIDYSETERVDLDTAIERYFLNDVS